MLKTTLEYLLDRHFVWRLRKGEPWDALLELGPGICLLFVLPKLGGNAILVDAVVADIEVSIVARTWVNQDHLESALGRMEVRFGGIANLAERAEIMSVIRLRLPQFRGD